MLRPVDTTLARGVGEAAAATRVNNKTTSRDDADKDGMGHIHSAIGAGHLWSRPHASKKLAYSPPTEEVDGRTTEQPNTARPLDGTEYVCKLPWKTCHPDNHGLKYQQESRRNDYRTIQSH